MQQPPEQPDQSATPLDPANSQQFSSPNAPLDGASHQMSPGTAPATNQWIAFSAIRGLPVVDLATGTRVGDVGDLILSPTYRYVEAYTSAGGAFHRDKTFPARGSSIGEHAVTLPRGAMDNWDVGGLDAMPRASTLLGMKLLTESGRIAGEIKEIRLDPTTGTVMAYDIHTPSHGLLDRLRQRPAHTLPTTAIMRYGQDAVIIQDALARQYLGAEE